MSQNDNSMRFKLFTGDFYDWNKRINQLEHMNWMQSWPFAVALHKRDSKSARCYILEIHNQEVGLCIINEIKFSLIHFVEINRGPLWLSYAKTQFGEETLWSLFLQALSELFPRRLLRRRRFLFELTESITSNEMIQKQLRMKFQLRRETFSTSILKLNVSELKLRENLRRNWRNHLSRGEKFNLKIKEDHSTQKVFSFLQSYQEHLLAKKYRGPSPQFVQEELKMAMQLQQALIYWVYDENETLLAAIYILLHGKSATYRIGWNTLSGRKQQAHYVLLWQIILNLKEKNVLEFDLGGLLPGEVDSIDHFKLGLGGTIKKLTGMYS